MGGVNDRGPEFDGVRIGRPATGALLDAGYSSLTDLPDDLQTLLKLHGVGSSAVRRLEAARIEQVRAVEAGVRTALSELDGTDEASLRLMTGLNAADIDDLGGLPRQ